jgi:hypothetical protein
MRVLFFNEGNLGTHVLGHGQLDAALRRGLADSSEVEARFAELTPMGRKANAAVNRSIEPLGNAHLDLQVLRWHVVQSLRARKALRSELDCWPTEVVHVYSHAIAFTMTGTMRRLPIVLAMDTTVRDWRAMPAWRPAHRYAPVTIAASRLLERRALRRAARPGRRAARAARRLRSAHAAGRSRASALRGAL